VSGWKGWLKAGNEQKHTSLVSMKHLQSGFLVFFCIALLSHCNARNLPAFLESQPPALISAIKFPPIPQTIAKKAATQKTGNKKSDDERWKYYFVKDLLSRRPPNKKRRLRQFMRIGLCVAGSLVVAAMSVATLEWVLERCAQEREQAFTRECAQRAEFLQQYRNLLVPVQSYYEQMDSRLCAMQRVVQREFGGVQLGGSVGDSRDSNGNGGDAAAAADDDDGSSLVDDGDVGSGVGASVRVRPRVRVRVGVGVRVGVPSFVSNGELERSVGDLRRRVREGSDAGWRPTIVFVGVFLGALGMSSYMSRKKSSYFRDVLEYAVSYWPAYKDCIPEELHGEFERLKVVVCDGGGFDEGEARRVLCLIDRVCCGGGV